MVGITNNTVLYRYREYWQYLRVRYHSYCEYVFRGYARWILVILRVLKVIRDSVLRILPLLRAFRGSILRVSWVLAVTRGETGSTRSISAVGTTHTPSTRSTAAAILLVPVVQNTHDTPSVKYTGSTSAKINKCSQ